MSATGISAESGVGSPCDRSGEGRLIVGVDDDGIPEGVLRWIVNRSSVFPRPILVVHAWHTAGRAALFGLDRENAEAAVAQPAAVAVAELRQHQLDATAMPILGGAAEALLSQAEAGDEIVLGVVEGRSTRHSVLPSVVHEVLHHADCPVVIVPTMWRPRIGAVLQVLVGVDDSTRSRAAEAWAIEEAARLGADLQLVYVGLDNEPVALRTGRDSTLLAEARSCAAALGLPLTITVVEVSGIERGSALALVEAARDAYALVLGNHRASWLAKVTQMSITERAAWNTSCPIVVVPS